MRETRAAAIWYHVDQFLRRTGAKEHEFADEVAELYHQRTPLAGRGVEFEPHAAGSNAYDVMRARGQLLFRMLKPAGAVRLPVELEEVVVLALPAPYREECLRELAERVGMLAAPLPAQPGDALARQVKSPCELLRSTADAVERLAPMLEDGRVEADDAPLFPAALAALSEVMGVCVTLQAQMAKAMQDASAKAPAGRSLRAVGAR